MSRGALPPIALPDAGSATAHPETRVAPVRRPLGPADVDALAALCPISTEHPDRAEHGRDWWPLAIHWALDNRTPSVPGAVARPTDVDQVSALLAECNRRAIAVTCSGGRSSVTGAAIAPPGAVALDMCDLRGVVSVDEGSGVVEVFAGTFGPELETQLRTTHSLSVGHFPQSFEISTVGGWVASRGAGQYSTRHGKIEDLVVGLEVVLADGTVVRTGGAPAGATGPDLTQVFIGSEGALGVITRVFLRAHGTPRCTAHSAWRVPTFAVGIDLCRRILRRGATPCVLRLYDEQESARSHGGDGHTATLLVLDEADEAIVDAVMGIVGDEARAVGCTEADRSLVEHWLEHRNDTSALQALVSRGYVVDTMEVAGNWSRLVDIDAAVREAALAVPGIIAATCHLSHSYLDGACLYFSFAGKPANPDDYERLYDSLWDGAQSAALDAGANLSHHHGIGRNRARFAPRALGEGHGVLVAIKTALDPAGILNPGVMGLGT